VITFSVAIKFSTNARSSFVTIMLYVVNNKHHTQEFPDSILSFVATSAGLLGHHTQHHLGRLVAHITDSPKPPPQRVTLTLPAVNAANCCVFAACGAGKADMMARLLAKEKEGLPAQLVMPK
jgi:6-phosphogluconolactonase/glucosamine-6-phosphate isomerase/deaminase